METQLLTAMSSPSLTAREGPHSKLIYPQTIYDFGY